MRREVKPLRRKPSDERLDRSRCRADGVAQLELGRPFGEVDGWIGVHQVVDGDSLFDLSGRYFAPLPRACGYWWAIADFQPDPILDPTLGLETGRAIVIPATRVLTDVILAESRRREQD